MPKKVYGVDEYSRYVEIDGERYAVEAYPFWRPFTPKTLWYQLVARVGILKWFWATRHRRELWKY